MCCVHADDDDHGHKILQICLNRIEFVYVVTHLLLFIVWTNVIFRWDFDVKYRKSKKNFFILYKKNCVDSGREGYLNVTSNLVLALLALNWNLKTSATIFSTKWKFSRYSRKIFVCPSNAHNSNLSGYHTDVYEESVRFVKSYILVT